MAGGSVEQRTESKMIPTDRKAVWSQEDDGEAATQRDCDLVQAGVDDSRQNCDRKLIPLDPGHGTDCLRVVDGPCESKCKVTLARRALDTRVTAYPDRPSRCRNDSMVATPMISSSEHALHARLMWSPWLTPLAGYAAPSATNNRKNFHLLYSKEGPWVTRSLCAYLGGLLRIEETVAKVGIRI